MGVEPGEEDVTAMMESRISHRITSQKGMHYAQEENNDMEELEFGT